VSSAYPSTNKNEVDACCHQHTSTTAVCLQHYTTRVKIRCWCGASWHDRLPL